MGVSVSGFYMWKRRKPSARSVRHEMVAEVIRQVHAELARPTGSACACRARARPDTCRALHCRAGDAPMVAGSPGRPGDWRSNTPTASDLVNRYFARTEPNRLWLTDITSTATCAAKGVDLRGPYSTRSRRSLVDRLVADGQLGRQRAGWRSRTAKLKVS